MDFAIPEGTPIRAAGAGTVVWADWATKLSASNQWWIAPAYAGICVVIDHGNGLLTLYAHLSSTSLNIGNRVSQGQQIGLSGTTGLSTGPHLHFEVLGWPLQPYNGFYGRLDPTKYVTSIQPQASLLANQRKVGAANVNMRAAANTTSKILRIIPANSIETFTGYFNGERVGGNNLWYRDAQGFAHSAGFTSVSAAGLPNTTPPPPVVITPANQRTVGKDNVNLRSQPNTSAPVIRVIPANTKEVFTGYVKGETVAGVNVWYKDAKGYAWAGGFTTQATTGLTDQTPTPAPAPTPTPAPPAPTPPVVTIATKKVVTDGVRLRNIPSTTGDVKTVLAGDSMAIVDGYVESQDVAGSKIWFTISGGYAHSSGFVDATIGNLPKKATPSIPVAPVEPAYSFTPDFPFVEYKPADKANMQVGNFPADPAKLVLHQFDEKAKNPSIDGVIGHFQTPRPDAPSSAHFAVSGGRTVQFVSLKDRAYHAGSVGNDYIGIEIDPQEDIATVASVKRLIAALNAKYGKKFEYTRHRDVPGNSTLCGADIHLEKYALDAPAPVTPPRPDVVVEPVPVPPVVVTPTPDPTPTPETPKTEEAIIDDFLIFMKEASFRNKQ
jgi:hypothetical protein